LLFESPFLFPLTLTLCTSLFLTLFPPCPFFLLLLSFDLTLFTFLFGLSTSFFLLEFSLFAHCLLPFSFAYLSFSSYLGSEILVCFVTGLLLFRSEFVSDLLTADVPDRI
jgi:hypothetical protein